MMNIPQRQPNEPSSVILPDELVAEVLSFCTVKSLTRLRCASKSVNSLISDPTFIKMHLKRSAPNTHLILFSSKSRAVNMDYSVVPVPVRRLLENPLNNIANNDAYYRLKKKSCFWVVGSCNGLLCLLGYRRLQNKTTEYQETWLRFWNPATRTISEKLGPICYYGNNPLYLLMRVKFSFGYDNLTDTYKVVAFSHSKTRVFCLGDNVWRNIQSFPLVPPFNADLGENNGVYLSNSLNWLVIRNNNYCYDSNDLTVEQFVIISFDLGSETYREFMPPPGFDEVPIVPPTVCVLMDFLCFSHDSKETDLVIWKMTQFGVEQSWTQFLKINYRSLQIARSGFVVDYEFSQWLPLHFSEKSDTLVMVNDLKSQRQAILYNRKDNRVEQTKVTDEITWKFSRDYVESLVSTC